MGAQLDGFIQAQLPVIAAMVNIAGQMPAHVQMLTKFDKDFRVNFAPDVFLKLNQAIGVVPNQNFAATGGLITPNGVEYMATGGMAKGTDTVPAMLTPGEFVMKKSAVDKYGVGFMRGVNNGVQGFAKGGPVQYLRKGSNGAVAAGSGGGPFAGAGELVSSINNTLDAFNQAFTAFSGLSNLLDNIISSISNINITHTINLQGSLNIPGFSQEAVNSIVSTIADQTADITNKQIRKALRQRDSDDENKT